MTTRTNLVVNPSLETDATSWESNSAFGGYDVATIARSTAQAWVGTASLQVTAPTPSAGKTWANTASIPVINGQVYTFSAYVRSATAATFYADAVFMERGPSVAVPADTWTRVSVTFVANTDHAFCGVGIDGAASGFIYFIDGALLEHSGDLDAYFDGDTSDTVDVTYSWTGTAHASTSTEVSPDPPASARFAAGDVLRLEVEADPEPGQLVNLVVNPDGEFGGYGWNSVQAGAYIAGVYDDVFSDPARWYLQYIGSTIVGASVFRTESMPMTAGQWVAARWHYIESGGDAYRARLSFLDANGSTISSTAYFNYNSTTDEVDSNTGPFQAPANTVAVRLAFEVGDPGGVYPISQRQASMRVTNVTVAVAATSAALGTTRTNIITNPSAETNTTGWTAINGTLSRIAAPAPAPAGTQTLRVTKSSGTGLAITETATGSASHVVSAGQTWRMQAQFRCGVATPVGSDLMFQAFWSNASGASLGNTDFGQATLDAADAWQLVEGTVQVPAGASRMSLRCTGFGPDGSALPNGAIMLVDAILCERYVTGQPTDYFDGSTPAAGTVSYAWTGTAHNSTSVATNSNLGFIEPVPYVDVLGDLRQISTAREELNLGTLSAVVVNPDLAPTVAATLRPGRRFRLRGRPTPPPEMGAEAIEDFTERVIVGKLANAKIDYFPANPDPAKRALITLTAVDPVSSLANAKRPNTVGTVPELPYVVEGAGVPWVTDGSSNQVSSANVVVVNDGASALDQVAITRDTAGGYAWVDRWGVLQVVSQFPDPTANHIVNGSFTGSVTFVNAGTSDGWVVNTALASRSTAAPPAPSADGGNAARFVPVGTQPLFRCAAQSDTVHVVSAVSYYDYIPVNEGGTYRAAGYLRSNVSRVAELRITGVPEGSTTPLAEWVVPYTATPTSSWGLWEIEFTVPQGVDRVIMEFTWAVNSSFSSNLPNTDIHWLDGVSLAAVQATPYVLDESVYNAPGLVVDYDTDRMINSVAVHRQWTHPSEGPQETVYGPYTDAASVSEWGLHHTEITVAGTAVSAIPAFASAILAANSEPQVRINQVQIPINRDTLHLAYIDLYDLVQVSNANLDLDVLMRVVGVSHSIVAGTIDTDDRWLMTLDFASENGIATPTQAPALPASVADSELYVDLAKNGNTFSVPNATATLVTGWTIIANTGGGTLAGSSKVITTSGLHAISGTATFVSGTSGRRELSLQVNGVDVARDEVATGSLVSLNAANTVFANAGDTVQMLVYQESGGALNIDGAASRSHFTVARLGG